MGQTGGIRVVEIEYVTCHCQPGRALEKRVVGAVGGYGGGFGPSGEGTGHPIEKRLPVSGILDHVFRPTRPSRPLPITRKASTSSVPSKIERTRASTNNLLIGYSSA